MYIHEAIAERTSDKPFIVRDSWLNELGCYDAWAPKILPTNSGLCCVVYTTLGKNGKDPCRGWQPTAGDLVADDWQPTS